MIESSERVEEFKAEIAAMRLKDPSTGHDAVLLRLGAALMVVGVIAAVTAFLLSHNSTDALAQRDDIIIALAGLTIAIVGGALFLRYSLAQFLRFWLARLIYEHQAQTDRLVGTARASGAGDTAINPSTTGAAAPHDS